MFSTTPGPPILSHPQRSVWDLSGLDEAGREVSASWKRQRRKQRVENQVWALGADGRLKHGGLLGNRSLSLSACVCARLYLPSVMHSSENTHKILIIWECVLQCCVSECIILSSSNTSELAAEVFSIDQFSLFHYFSRSLLHAHFVSVHLSVSLSLICPLFLQFHRELISFLRSHHDGWVKLTATSCFKTSSAQVCLIKFAQKTFISHYISLTQSCCLSCSPCYFLIVTPQWKVLCVGLSWSVAPSLVDRFACYITLNYSVGSVFYKQNETSPFLDKKKIGNSFFPLSLKVVINKLKPPLWYPSASESLQSQSDAWSSLHAKGIGSSMVLLLCHSPSHRSPDGERSNQIPTIPLVRRRNLAALD